MEKIICPVVGASFRQSEDRDALRSSHIGTLCYLEADPDNEYDETAVRVMIEGHHVGFIPKDTNGPIFPRLMAGEKMVGEIISFEKPLRPLLEIEL